jgi:hypothetical protein
MNQNALRWILPGLCVALFGNAISAAPHDFGKWEKEISAYEAVDRTNPPPSGSFVFVGSSTIRMWKSLATDFSGFPVVNRGFGGCEIMDCTHFASRIVIPYKPRAVFLRAGGNDIHAGKSAQEVFGNFKEFVATVRAALPEVEVFYISVSPAISRWTEAGESKALNDLIKEFSSHTPHTRYIETYDLPLDTSGKPRPEVFLEDKLHFNAAGYKLLADRVRPYLSQVGQRNGGQ